MNIQNHPVVSREEWLVARQHHLAHEKAFTRERDKLSAERRALPWVKIDKDYHFQGPHGELKLADAETLNGARVCLIFPLNPHAASTADARASVPAAE